MTEGDSVNSWVRVFQIEGNYKPTDNGRHEHGFEKIAIYAKDGKPTHVARQIGAGGWTSKLGRGVDIEHDNLERLTGDSKSEYGAVVKFLVRRKRKVSRAKK